MTADIPPAPQPATWIDGEYRTSATVLIAVRATDGRALNTQNIRDNSKPNEDADTKGEWWKCRIGIDESTREVLEVASADDKTLFEVLQLTAVAEPEVIGGYVGSSTPQVDETPLDYRWSATARLRTFLRRPPHQIPQRIHLPIHNRPQPLRQMVSKENLSSAQIPLRIHQWIRNLARLQSQKVYAAEIYQVHYLHFVYLHQWQ